MIRRFLQRFLSLLILVALLLCAVLSASADSGEYAWMRLGARPMCKRLPNECLPYKGGSPFAIELTRELHLQLDQVNRAVNKEITYQTDMDHYGVPELWTYPFDGRGDCEDYVLEKRRRLVRLGWPRRVLLMTIVDMGKDKPEAHAVLTVRTNVGDLILDSNEASVLGKEVTRYGYLMIQSQRNPRSYEKVVTQ